MKRLTKKAKREILSELASDSRAGRTDWSLIADLLIRFMDEHPRSETTRDFVDWLGEDVQATMFVDIDRKWQIKKFISDWVAEKDIPKFMAWLKSKDQALWDFLNDPAIDGDESFEVWYR